MKQSHEAIAEPYESSALQALAERHGTPLLLVDCERIRRNYRALKIALPNVDIHYAMKALSLPEVAATLAREGSGFDVATTGEIEILRRLAVDPARCIHTHPIKTRRDIEAALAFGIRVFVADNIDELHKFVAFRDAASVLIRIGFASAGATVDLSKKFGCSPADVSALLEACTRLGIEVAGFAVHPGSQPKNSDKHVQSISTVIELMMAFRNQAPRAMSLLDIGGGFPTQFKDTDIGIEAFCVPIQKTLESVPRDIRIISEPGRFIAASSGTCLTSVVGRAMRNGRWWYYLDDGAYGSFSGQVTEPTVFPIDSLRQSAQRLPSALTGPTCDGFDMIADHIELPKLEIGDVLVGRVMGAYTAASASDFNLVPRARLLPVNFESGVA